MCGRCYLISGDSILILSTTTRGYGAARFFHTTGVKKVKTGLDDVQEALTGYRFGCLLRKAASALYVSGCCFLRPESAVKPELVNWIEDCLAKSRAVCLVMLCGFDPVVVAMVRSRCLLREMKWLVSASVGKMVNGRMYYAARRFISR